MSHTSSRTALFCGVTAALLAGIGGGWLLRGGFLPVSAAIPIREPEGKYRLIDPLIGFRAGEKSEFTEYHQLGKKVRDQIDSLTEKEKVHSASVYFRDMQSGHWTGVNEEELYSPASLYKVALMIAVLKRAESEPALLEGSLVFKGVESLEASDNPPLIVGKGYSVRELLERLIILSDNEAKEMLRAHIGNEAVSIVFADLRLQEPALRETGDSMSAQTYSRFFRALYNATYLSRNASEYALDLLSHVEFKSGIVNGLPAAARTLTVAHKFGYRVFEYPTDAVTEEIHDCGIVYVPERPYFVCIMTKGYKETDLLDTIQILSRTVYEEARSAVVPVVPTL